VRTGWILDRVGDRDLDTLRRAWRSTRTERERQLASAELAHAAMRLLRGTSGSQVRASFRQGSGRRIDVDLVRQPATGEVVRFGLLPPMVAHLESTRYLQDWGCVGVVRFNVWMTPIVPAFERALDSLASCDGLILDLRGNPGGVAAMIMGMAGAFLDQPQVLGVLRARGNELRYTANPRRVATTGRAVRPIEHPLAILIDPLSASTSEIFAASLQHLGRARIFGETSAGQALPAALHRLPNDDVLLHAIGDFLLPDGRRLEGRGVRPDELVPLTRDDLLAERDAPLLAALAWIRTTRGRHPTGS
jgi:carboxyl-terminal processing protease